MKKSPENEQENNHKSVPGGGEDNTDNKGNAMGITSADAANDPAKALSKDFGAGKRHSHSVHTTRLAESKFLR